MPDFLCDSTAVGAAPAAFAIRALGLLSFTTGISVHLLFFDASVKQGVGPGDAG